MYFTKSTLLLATAGLAQIAAAAYSVLDDYSGDKFFDMFTFDTENDYTNGYVNYLDESDSQNASLISVDNGVVTIRSDSTNIASGRGRNSVRITSRNQYTHGLVILDLQHMPSAACGIWPAFWSTGPSWPNNGEIDIIEGVNYQAQNAMTLHTNSGCTLMNQDCSWGCGIENGGTASFGDGFNGHGGGIYALEWTSDAINIFNFARSNIPADALSESPDPTGWGTPTASFVGGSGCTIDQHFNNHQIVFDTTFCGDWAGGVWSQTQQCYSQAASCQDYVQNNPRAFAGAYWTINSLKVFTANSVSTRIVAVPSSTSSSSSSSTSTSTSASTSTSTPHTTTATSAVKTSVVVPSSTSTSKPISTSTSTSKSSSTSTSKLTSTSKSTSTSRSSSTSKPTSTSTSSSRSTPHTTTTSLVKKSALAPSSTSTSTSHTTTTHAAHRRGLSRRMKHTHA